MSGFAANLESFLSGQSEYGINVASFPSLETLFVVYLPKKDALDQAVPAMVLGQDATDAGQGPEGVQLYAADIAPLDVTTGGFGPPIRAHFEIAPEGTDRVFFAVGTVKSQADAIAARLGDSAGE